MKRIIFTALAAVALLCGCGGKSESAANEPQDAEAAPVQPKDNIDRSDEVTLRDTIAWRGATYIAQIHLQSCDSAGLITDEAGFKYADNTATLRITQGSREFLKRVITKSTFRPYLSDDLYARYRFSGMVFDQVTDGNLRFAASVGDPAMDDDFVPFSITITPSGAITIARDNTSDLTPTLPTDD